MGRAWVPEAKEVQDMECTMLDQLRTDIREERQGKLSKDVLLQQENARVHSCKVAMDAVE